MKTTLEAPMGDLITNPRSLQERQAATLAALDSFMEQEEEEHRESLLVLRHALAEDRSSQRQVFGEKSASS